MPKVTFSLDDEAVRLLRRAAERTRKPQSLVVREAIAQYAAREEKLSDEERERLLKVLRDIKGRPVTRSQDDVDRELQDVRRSRRSGWSRPGG
jgi:predicted transcriptional regulator